MNSDAILKNKMKNPFFLREIEYQDFSKNSQNSHAEIKSVSEDYSHWEVYIPGPRNTPFEGGFFLVAIDIGDDYPENPPKCKFITPIYHPNVTSQGTICLNILDKQWNVNNRIFNVVDYIYFLMARPNTDDPLRTDIAKMITTEYFKFKEIAKEQTKIYARKDKY